MTVMFSVTVKNPNITIKKCSCIFGTYILHSVEPPLSAEEFSETSERGSLTGPQLLEGN